MTTRKTSGSSNSRGSRSLFSHVKYEHLLAGISGGVASTLILHPLDLLKIRFAVNDGRSGVVRVGGGVAEAAAVRPQYRSLTGAISTIVQQEGFRGLYRGVTPNIWGSGSAWGFYFLFYNAIKTWIQGGNTKKPLGPGLHMLAAAEAGILTLVMTNPIWVVKTRLCLQYGESPLSGAVRLSESQSYNGMLDALKKIYTYEGIRGLYKGFVPGIFGVSHGALQFMTYEEMKNFYNHYRGTPIDTRLTTLEYLSFAAMSKLCAAAATYPYQVVRARLQDQRGDYTGTMDCVRRTWRYEGVRGFYKGLVPNLLRVTPATAITFVVYENVSGYLLNPNPESNSNEVTTKEPKEEK